MPVKFGIFTTFLLVFSMFAVAFATPTSVPIDDKGVITVTSATPSVFYGQCNSGTAASGGDYALELYGRVIFQGTDVDPEALMAKCADGASGVDEIVRIIDEKTRGKDLAAACGELDDQAARCDANKAISCDGFKGGDAGSMCPPDAVKLVEYCKSRFKQSNVDRCEEEYSRNRDKIEKYCNGDYKPIYEAKPPVQERREFNAEEAEAKCSKYGGAWLQGQCEFQANKPLYQIGKCPPLERDRFQCPNGGNIVEQSYNDQSGLQCSYLSCEYPSPEHPVPGSSIVACPSISVPSCSTGQYAQAQSGQNTSCPSNYQCVPNSGSGGSCAAITMPSCPSGQYAQPQYEGGSSCPSSYQCVASSTSGTSCSSQVMPVCPVGQYAQAQSGQNTSCPSNYQCVPNSGSGSGGSTSSCDPTYCPPEPTLPSCSSGTTLATNNYQYTPSGCSAPHTCTNHYCESSSSGSSSSTSCPAPQSCSSGTATATGRSDSAGCMIYECPPVTVSASRISGLVVETTQPSEVKDVICPKRVYDPEIEARVSAACEARGGRSYVDKCGFTACDTSGSGERYDFCTKEGFLRKCRGAVFDNSYALSDDEAAAMCEREVKYHLPEVQKFCEQTGSGNSYNACKANAAESCTCLKAQFNVCKTYANRDKFLAIVREKAMIECKKRMLFGSSEGELLENVDKLKEDLNVQDKVTAENVVKTYTFTQEELDKFKAETAEAAKADALIKIKTLLGIESDRIAGQIISLKQQCSGFEDALAGMKEVCSKTDSEVCAPTLLKLQGSVDACKAQVSGLESDQNGLIGAIGNLLSQLFSGQSPTATTSTTASATTDVS